MITKSLVAGISLGLLTAFFSLQISYAQVNECTAFDGSLLVVLHAKPDCLGYADGKMATDGWKIVGISNETIYMLKQIK